MNAVDLLALNMSPRARAYLWSTFFPNFVMGLFCIFGDSVLLNPSYSRPYSIIYQVGFHNFVYWGVAFLLVAGGSAYAAIRGRESAARRALVGSAVIAGAWATGFAIAYFQGHLSGPTGVLIWGTIAVKDLIVCRQPLSSPFEAITRVFGKA